MNYPFLEPASDFLSYHIIYIPFTFLGILISINPCRKSSWDVLLVELCGRIVVWKGKNLSIAGCVTFINSVLSSLPLYLIYFYRTPKLVIWEITNIQRAFLLFREEKKRQINWVEWDTVYKSKVEGALEIREEEVCNRALLSRWGGVFFRKKFQIGTHYFLSNMEILRGSLWIIPG